jgi:hypothetical protein
MFTPNTRVAGTRKLWCQLNVRRLQRSGRIQPAARAYADMHAAPLRAR